MVAGMFAFRFSSLFTIWSIFPDFIYEPIFHNYKIRTYHFHMEGIYINHSLSLLIFESVNNETYSKSCVTLLRTYELNFTV